MNIKDIGPGKGFKLLAFLTRTAKTNTKAVINDALRITSLVFLRPDKLSEKFRKAAGTAISPRTDILAIITLPQDI